MVIDSSFAATPKVKNLHRYVLPVQLNKLKTVWAFSSDQIPVSVDGISLLERFDQLEFPKLLCDFCRKHGTRFCFGWVVSDSGIKVIFGNQGIEQELNHLPNAVSGGVAKVSAFNDPKAVPIRLQQGRLERFETFFCRTSPEVHPISIVVGICKKAEASPIHIPILRLTFESTPNRLVNCVVAIFKNAVAGELINVATIQRLQTLEPLRNGQTDAYETDEVLPANLAHVRATATHLSPIVKSMLRIQIATGMRPKEICHMRPCDIDRSGETWLYAPSKHKTSWRGKTKVIPLVDDAREAITDYLQRDPDSFCFSPAEAMAWRRAVGTANRTTPLSCGNRPGTNVKANPKRLPRDQYDAQSYRTAIQRAAKKAKVPKWHPYQLRHLTATVVRAALGIEETQALLGHSKAAMTAHYARESVEAATRAAKAAPKL